MGGGTSARSQRLQSGWCFLKTKSANLGHHRAFGFITYSNPKLAGEHVCFLSLPVVEPRRWALGGLQGWALSSKVLQMAADPGHTQAAQPALINKALALVVFRFVVFLSFACELEKT